MSDNLGIITAYSAAALLAWLAVLLYPRLLPASEWQPIRHRWRTAAFFALAAAATAGLIYLRNSGNGIAGMDPVSAALGDLLLFVPAGAYIIYVRSRAALLIPQKNIARSLFIGACLSLAAIAAHASVVGFGWITEAADAAHLLRGALRSLLHALFIGAFLALLVQGWRTAVALGAASVAILAMHLPGLIESGLSLAWLATMLVHQAVSLGLVSAIAATGNVVWFWPVHAALTLAQVEAFSGS